MAHIAYPASRVKTSITRILCDTAVPFMIDKMCIGAVAILTKLNFAYTVVQSHQMVGIFKIGSRTLKLLRHSIVAKGGMMQKKQEEFAVGQ